MLGFLLNILCFDLFIILAVDFVALLSSVRTLDTVIGLTLLFINDGCRSASTCRFTGVDDNSRRY